MCQVYALVDHEGGGVNVQVHKVLTGQNQPNGVAWHKNSLYVAEVGQITRYDNPDAFALSGQVRDVGLSLTCISIAWLKCQTVHRTILMAALCILASSQRADCRACCRPCQRA